MILTPCVILAAGCLFFSRGLKKEQLQSGRPLVAMAFSASIRVRTKTHEGGVRYLRYTSAANCCNIESAFRLFFQGVMGDQELAVVAAGAGVVVVKRKLAGKTTRHCRGARQMVADAN